MPPRKNTKPKRSNRPRRKVQRKRNKMPGNAIAKQLVCMNKMPDKPMRFVKTIYGGVTLTGVSGPIYNSYSFSMNALADFNDIAILFNRYKLNKITHTFTLRSASGTAGGLSGSTQLPKLFCRYNYDSNIVSSNIPSTLQEANNVINHTFTEDSTVFQYSIVPRTIQPVYRSTLLTGYELQKRTYIDAAYPDVPHYGLMIWTPFLANGDEILIDITYDFSMKYQF